MKPKSVKLMTGLTFVALLTGCASPAPPTPPLNVEKVGQAITDASAKASGTTILTNVFNGSGKSCVQASQVRGRAIADKLQDMKLKGDIPENHSIEVHTFSGYKLPLIGSMHTYTVTQIRDKSSGKVVETWTTDDYLGPNRVKHVSGDGGYTYWDEFKIDLVKPTPRPVIKPFNPGGNGGGGGGGSH